MGWFTYKCEEHGEIRISLDKRKDIAICPKCGSVCKAVLKAGTMRVVERLDNGTMARRVERLHNIEEIMDERDRKHSVKQDDE